MEQEQRSKQTILIVLGSLIFILGISSVILFFQNRLLKQQIASIQTSPSPSPEDSADPTADWKTYTNEEYNLSFKYPSSWIYGEDSSMKNRKAYNVYLRPESTKPADPTFGEINVWITSSKDSLIEYANKEYCVIDELCGLNPENITISGLNAIIIKGLGALPSEKIIFKDENTIVEFHFNFEGENYQDYTNTESKQIFDQILSTFKFIDQEKPVVSSPQSGSEITSPLTVNGTAPAGWMFEGQLVLKLLDSNKNVITQGAGKEKVPGSWQNGESTEFGGTLTFTTSEASGFLVIEADNPSGLPENVKSYEIPVKFN